MIQVIVTLGVIPSETAEMQVLQAMLVLLSEFGTRCFSSLAFGLAEILIGRMCYIFKHMPWGNLNWMKVTVWILVGSLTKPMEDLQHISPQHFFLLSVLPISIMLCKVLIIKLAVDKHLQTAPTGLEFKQLCFLDFYDCLYQCDGLLVHPLRFFEAKLYYQQQQLYSCQCSKTNIEVISSTWQHILSINPYGLPIAYKWVIGNN